MSVLRPPTTAVTNTLARQLAGQLADRSDWSILDEQWADLTAWVEDQTGGTVAVDGSGNCTFTVVDASIGLYANILGEIAEPYLVEFDATWAGPSGMRFRVSLITSADGLDRCYIELYNTAVNLGIDGSVTAVTPANYDNDARNRFMLAVDPLAKTVDAYILHWTTANTDKYEYLGRYTMAVMPNRIRCYTGGGAGLATLGRLRITRPWAAVMGDSLATGSPLYSPVPRMAGRDDTAVTSSIAYWIEQAAGGDKRVLTLGRGGENLVTHVEPRITDWFGHIKPKAAIIWAGTNDINGSADLADMRAALASIMTQLSTAGVVAIICNTVPRTLFPTTQKEIDRVAWNAWLAQAVPAAGGVLVDMDAAVRNPYDTDTIASPWTPDGVHLTATGYHRAARAIIEAIHQAT